MPDDKLAQLRLDAPRSGTVGETAEYLQTLEICYRHLYIFNEWIDDLVEGELTPWHPSFAAWYSPQPHTLTTIQTPLRISAVQLQSPGFWEFVGSLNPMEVLRKYLGDRHERRKDREWREPLEAEKLRLENERLRTQVVSDRVELLQKVGVPKALIRQAVASHVTQPLATLDPFQDSGLIGGVLVKPSTPNPPPNPGRGSRAIRLSDDEPERGREREKT